jgi:hypothetical protein
MEKRVDKCRRVSLAKLKSSKEAHLRISENLNDEVIGTGVSKKPKFISSNGKKAKKAVERYEKDQRIPGAPNAMVQKKRASYTKYKERYTGYEIPFHAKPIKIHCESSCTNEQYRPGTISTKGIVISRIKTNASKGTNNLPKNTKTQNASIQNSDYKSLLAIGNETRKQNESRPRDKSTPTSNTKTSNR